jgi:tetratricopeptide (TPR) repeat protein
LGNHHLRSNNAVEAGRCYKKAIELNADFYEAYNNIGFILKHLGKHEEAISYFEQCLEIAPEYEPAQKDLKASKNAIKKSKG